MSRIIRDLPIKKIIPKNIFNCNYPFTKLNNNEAINKLETTIGKNKLRKNYIGQGYYPSNMPEFIRKQVLENPVWYSAYTPYQPEISQGRLEMLFNYQKMITDITQMDFSNASLLDEASACGEALLLINNFNKNKTILIDEELHSQNKRVIETKAKYLNINLQPINRNYNKIDIDNIGGLFIQNPSSYGKLINLNNDTYFSNLIKELQFKNIPIVEVSDLLYSCIYKPAGENNFDISVGSTQRFGLPLFFGGPHSGFIACKEKYLRKLPGRIVGKSIDNLDQEVFRLALQTREQHIRKEKATSNICTAQSLPAILSTFYAIYHGPDTLKNISTNIHDLASIFLDTLKNYNIRVLNDNIYDTIYFKSDPFTEKILANNKEFNFNSVTIDNNKYVGVSFHELSSHVDLYKIADLIGIDLFVDTSAIKLHQDLIRESPLLQDPVFNTYNDELRLSRYIHELGLKDYSLVNGMIPLGSCTMKLNPAYTMSFLSNKLITDIHPYAPKDQTEGYTEIVDELKDRLKYLTGMDDISFQPQSGSTGEYAGLIAIKDYQLSLGHKDKNICIIPDSAHGTNFSSAKLAGFNIVKLKTLPTGEISITHLNEILTKHKEKVSCIMITYPSTFGIFDDNIKEIIELVHNVNGQVYMDGANLNAQLGWTNPGFIGADLCHLNLHKTFAIPHGGGGPGVGPICVKKHLSPFIPSENKIMVSGSAHGSASILTISLLYLMSHNLNSLKDVSLRAIENANYLMDELKGDFKISFTKNNMCGHEFIIDLSEFTQHGVSEFDIAKRLIDYNFHPPTLSWPINKAIMIEPTETESKEELDRFIKALKSIKKEIYCNPEIVKNAPYNLDQIKNWNYNFTLQEAFFPNDIKKNYFPSVGRVNESYGDMNLKLK